MAVIEIISACIAAHGAAESAKIARLLAVLDGLTMPLVIANTINIAADFAAMGEALRLVVNGLALRYALLFGLGHYGGRPLARTRTTRDGQIATKGDRRTPKIRPREKLEPVKMKYIETCSKLGEATAKRIAMRDLSTKIVRR